MFDAVTIIPFVRIFEASTQKNLFYAVKVLRIKKGLYLLDTSKFKQSIKRSYEEKLRKKIEQMKEDNEAMNLCIDHTEVDK